VHHSGENTVGLSPVPVIVKSPDHHVVFFNEGTLLGPHGIAFVHALGLVEMMVEGRLVSDDEVLMVGGGALQDVERGHHGYGDSGYRFVGVAGFEGVDGFCHPRDADMILNGLYDFAGGGLFGLGVYGHADGSGEHQC
jgi:hypothetical protein